jgi:FdhD protein
VLRVTPPGDGRSGGSASRADFLAGEEPLGIRVDGAALVQKAILAGIPLLAAVSAPSSLAVDLAEQADLTLVGFLRGRSMNVYTGVRRLSA